MTDSDDGFTLIELLIAVAVMAIVMGAAATAFVVGVRVSNESTRTLATSQDAAFTSATFVRDVQGASSVKVNLAGGAGIVGDCTASGVVLSLSATTPESVDYVYTVVDGVGQLHRTPCGAQAGASLVVARQLTVIPFGDCRPSCAGPKAVDLVVTTGAGATQLTATRRTS